MKKVTGIGGIFFKCQNPELMRAWYADYLGFEVDEYGTSFEQHGFAVWSPFKETTTYFAPSTKDFMINFRVADIEALVGELKARGVTVLDEIESYEYGKFVHILDVEGNKLELWQPIDEEYAKIATITKP
ncbi:MAG: VOC family protein [Bacteroidetes bacterium]|nr:MAG: VOC family protein [Bacteroidota bacterium]